MTNHKAAKNSIPLSEWDYEATFGVTFSNGNDIGAEDVEVCVAECDGYWYIRTKSANGADDCDATPYRSAEEARKAAREYAEQHDECDGLSAEQWLAREREREREASKSPDGNYVLVHRDGTRWDGDRYSDKEAAEAAIEAWYEGVRASNPGAMVLFHLMDTPRLAVINEDGSVEMIEE